MVQHIERILYLRDILLQETDADHPLGAQQLISRLEQLTGQSVERKTIYRDISGLKNYGMDIHLTKRMDGGGYYVGKRVFDLAELKLLVDAVQSSKFISENMTEGLIKRIEDMTSHYQAGQLQRQVYILHRAKTMNDTALENVDRIHQAIHHNQQISFLYGEWNREKKMRPRRGGKSYRVSPWALVWNDENYYLVSYSQEAEGIRHYRVDKMLRVEVKEEKREGEETFRSFDLPSYTQKTFGMFGGQDSPVCLRCANDLAGVIIDRFGRDVIMIPDGEDHFRVHVEVAVSPQFFGWLTGIGEGMQIVSPQGVADHYATYLGKIMHVYSQT